MQEHVQMGVDVLADVLNNLRLSALLTTHARVLSLILYLVQQRIELLSVEQLEQLAMGSQSLQCLYHAVHKMVLNHV